MPNKIVYKNTISNLYFGKMRLITTGKRTERVKGLPGKRTITTSKETEMSH
jgi:hypothetical protein